MAVDAGSAHGSIRKNSLIIRLVVYLDFLLGHLSKFHNLFQGFTFPVIVRRILRIAA